MIETNREKNEVGPITNDLTVVSALFSSDRMTFADLKKKSDQERRNIIVKTPENFFHFFIKREFMYYL